MQSAYEVLGVAQDATPEQIDAAFVAQQARHPQDLLQESPEASLRFKRIAFAHRVLHDPASRREHDRKMAAPAPRPAVPARSSGVAVRPERPQLRLLFLLCGVAALVLAAGVAWKLHRDSVRNEMARQQELQVKAAAEEARRAQEHQERLQQARDDTERKAAEQERRLRGPRYPVTVTVRVEQNVRLTVPAPSGQSVTMAQEQARLAQEREIRDARAREENAMRRASACASSPAHC